MRASDLVNRLLGIPTDNRQKAGTPTTAQQAIRAPVCGVRCPARVRVSSGTGIAQVRGDPHEEDPVTVVRRLGIGQFNQTLTCTRVPNAGCVWG